MKLIFPSDQIVNNIAELTAKPTATLSNFQLVYDTGTDTGYQYLTMAEQGVFRPDDATGNTGYWKADTANVIKEIAYLVQDSHVLGPNETEYDDPTTVIIAESVGKIDSYVVKDIFKNHTLPNWETLDFSDQKTLTSYFVAPFSEETFDMNNYWNEEEVSINQQILINKNIDAIKARYGCLKTMLRLKMVDDELAPADAKDLFMDMDPIFNLTASMGPRFFSELVDYFRSQNDYLGNGFQEKTYFSNSLQDEILDIVEHGIYEKPDLFII